MNGKILLFRLDEVDFLYFLVRRWLAYFQLCEECFTEAWS